MSSLQVAVFLLDESEARKKLDEEQVYQELKPYLALTRGVLNVARENDIDDSCIALIAEVSEGSIWEFMRSIERFFYQRYDLPHVFEVAEVLTLDCQYKKLVEEYVSFRRVESEKVTSLIYKNHVKAVEALLQGLSVNKQSVEKEVNYSKDMENYLDELRQVIASLKILGSSEHLYSKTLLVAIDDGWGYTYFLEKIRKELLAGSLVEEKRIRVEERKITRSGDKEKDARAWESEIGTIKQTMDAFRRDKSIVVCSYDMREWVSDFSSQEILNYIRKMKQVSCNLFMVFRIPYMDIKTVRKIEETLSDATSIRSVIVHPVSSERLVAYLKKKLSEANLIVDSDCDDELEQWICQEKNDGHFFGYKSLDKMASELIYHKALYPRNEEDVENTKHISQEDVVPMLKHAFDGENPYQMLADLIGMAQVKARVREIVAQIKLQKSLEEQGKSVGKPTMHMLFVGNPGTGKTTVARIIGQIFKQEGLLRKGLFYEKTGNDFIQRYVGTTIQAARSICRDAYGSVLFIDEAYGISVGTANGSTAEEIVPILVAEMENHRDDMCVILAGYEDEMKEFLKQNAGLESRIPHVIEFPNYTREELIEIFFSILDGKFEYSEDVKELLIDYINNIPENVFERKEFSNGRFVRNIYERLWGKAAYRISLSGEEISIKREDMISMIEEEDFSSMVEEKTKRPIGF